MDVSLITYLNDKRFPRGIRNNNFGNIRRSRAMWKGKIPFDKSKDKAFEQFFKAYFGIRALIITLRSYYFKHKLTSVEGIINRWAPSSENNSVAYIESVCDKMAVQPDSILNWDQGTIFKLVHAISIHENGKDLITRELFDYAWDRL